jgi:hypothetical protein
MERLRKTLHCFYATRKGERPKGVNASSQWHSNINSTTDLLQKKITRSTTLRFECSNINETLEVKKLGADTLGKRKWPQTHNDIAETSIQMKEVSVLDMNSTKELSSLAQFPTVCPHTSFWLSPEAFILFKPDNGETVLEAIKNQIEFLGEANKSDFGYTELIENINDFNLTDVGTYQIFSLRQKCTYLALALTLAKDNMNQWTWKKCCEEAIAMLQKAGMRQTSNPQTVMEWYRQFRTKRRFTMPCQKNQYLHSLSIIKISQYPLSSTARNIWESFQWNLSMSTCTTLFF